MQWLFTMLSRAVEGSPSAALAGAMAWGVLSILLSPCHLASIPLIVGFIDKQGRVSSKRALALSSLFAFGILLTIAAIGVATAAAGRLAGNLGGWANYCVAGIFFVFGLHLMDVICLPLDSVAPVPYRRRGLLAALVLGLLFGLALGPCTFAYMAPILGVTFKLGASNAAYATLLLLAYGAGHCAIIVAAGASTGLVQRYLQWSGQSNGAVMLRRLCGALIVIGGLYLICIAP